MQDFLKQIIQAAEKAGGQLANNPLVKAVQSAPPPVSSMPASQIPVSTPITQANPQQDQGNYTPTAQRLIADPATQDITDAMATIPNAVRSISSDYRMRADPQAKAKLDAINNSNLSIEEKAARANALAQNYGGPTPEVQAGAQTGAENLLGMGVAPELGGLGDLQGAGLEHGVAQAGVAAQAGKAAVKNAASEVAQTGADIVNNARTFAEDQPGGLQRGSMTPSEFINPSTPELGQFINPTTKEPIQAKVQPQTGGKYINETPADLKGGTPSQVRARPASEVNFKYVAPEISSETPIQPQPAPIQGEVPSMNPSSSSEDVPLNQAERPTQPALSLRQKAIQKLNGLGNYQLPSKDGEYRVPLENQDKSVMQNVVGGNTSKQVLERVPQAKNDVWGQVEAKAANHTDISTNKQVLPYIKKEVDKLVSEGTVTQEQADAVLEGEHANLTQSGADITGDANINGKQFITLQKGANAQAPKNIPYGSTNPVPYLRKAVADGYRNAMGNLDPEISNLYQQYSSLKRIGKMSNDFRNQKLNLGQIPHTGISVPFTGAGRRLAAATLNGDKRALATLGVGGAAVVASQLPKISDTLANNLGYVKKGSQDNNTSEKQNHKGDVSGNDQNKDIHNGQSVSNSSKNVNSIPSLDQIKDTGGNKFSTNIGEFDQKIKALNAQKGELDRQQKLADQVGALSTAGADSAKISSQIATLQEQKNNTQAIIAAHTNAANQYRQLEEAKTLMDQAPPEWWNALGGKENPVQYGLSKFFSPYGDWQAKVNSLQSQYGGLSGVSTAGSGDVAKSIIDQQEKAVKDNLKQTLSDNGGVIQESSNSNGARPGAKPLGATNFKVSTTTNTPTQLPSTPQAINQAPPVGTAWPAMATQYH